MTVTAAHTTDSASVKTVATPARERSRGHSRRVMADAIRDVWDDGAMGTGPNRVLNDTFAAEIVAPAVVVAGPVEGS